MNEPVLIVLTILAIALVALALVRPPYTREACVGFPTWVITWGERGHLKHYNYHGRYILTKCLFQYSYQCDVADESDPAHYPPGERC